MEIKIKGLKKAIGDYKRANEGGPYSPRYGRLMMDEETFEVWTDEFYSLGHNSWNEYANPCVINLGQMMAEEGYEISMKGVKKYINDNYKEN